MPVSKAFKVVVMGNGHKVAAWLYAPAPVTGGTRALGKVVSLDCQLEWNVPEETPKACLPFLLPSFPLSPGHIPIPATPLCGGCFHHRWGDPKEGSWRWEPVTWRHGAQGAFQSSSSPEAPYPLSAVGVVSLQAELPGSGGCGLVQRGTGTPGPLGRAHWLAPPSHLPQSQDSPSKGPKPDQASGMWPQPRSLGPEGNRVRILFL